MTYCLSYILQMEFWMNVECSSKLFCSIYGSGHKGAAVLLYSFAISW